MASAAKERHRGRTFELESNAKRMQTASETGSSSTGTMSNPQPQGSIEEDTNQTPRAHTPATPTVGSYEWALEQKQQLVDNPPPLVTEDALRQEKFTSIFTVARAILAISAFPSI
jgi:hypothetical protein